jgi:hypothetical protein
MNLIEETKITINKCEYICNVCKKKYTKKSSLDKHKILCDFKLKTKREKKIDEEEDEDKPDYLQLVKIVQELSIKCNNLEKKVEQMEKWVQRKKKKINIIEWLNNNINASVSYLEWINTNIEVETKHFVYLMEHNLYQTIEYIIIDIFKDEDFIYPIKCFTEKNIFYIVDKDENNNSLWKKGDQKDILLIFKKIYFKMLNELTKWKKENEYKFDENPKLCELFNKAVIKLMDINISCQQDTVFSRLRGILFNYIKTDIKAIIEYDFDFN